MDGFSVSSIVNLCSTVSNRGIACYQEINTLVQGTARVDGNVWDLVSLAGLLRDLQDNLVRLEEVMGSRRIMTEQLQASLNQALPTCEAVFARLQKQLSRLDQDNIVSLDEGYVHMHQAFMATHSQLAEFWIELLQTQDRAIQELKMTEAGAPIFYQAGSAAQVAMEAADIFGEHNVESPSQSQKAVLNQPVPDKDTEAYMEVYRPPADLEVSPPPYTNDEATPAYQGQSLSSKTSSPTASPVSPTSPTTPVTPITPITSIASNILPVPQVPSGPPPPVPPVPTIPAIPASPSDPPPSIPSAPPIPPIPTESEPNSTTSNFRRNTVRRVPSKKGLIRQKSLFEPFRAMTSNWLPKSDMLVGAMCQAATRGDEAQLRGLVSQGGSVNCRGDNGDTPLDCAVSAGHVESARLLLEHQANVKHVSKTSGLPPVYRAAALEDMEMLKLLFSYNADLNQRSLVGQPYFIEACKTVSKDVVKALLDNGADANSISVLRRSVLVQAVKDDDYELSELLLKAGANANATEVTGASLLSLAMKKEDEFRFASLLLDHGASPDSETVGRNRVLVDAITSSRADAAKFLLDRHAKGHGSAHGTSLLLYVLEDNIFSPEEKFDIVRRLLNNGAAPNKDFKRNRPALAYALENEMTDIFELLLENGAKADYKINGGDTMLTYCVREQKVVEARLLLEQGADVNEPDKQGVVPLQVAFTKYSMDMMNLLLEHGAFLDEGTMAQLEGFDLTAICGQEQELADLEANFGTGRNKKKLQKLQKRPPT